MLIGETPGIAFYNRKVKIVGETVVFKGFAYFPDARLSIFRFLNCNWQPNGSCRQSFYK